MGRKKLNKIGVANKVAAPMQTMPKANTTLYKAVFEDYQYHGESFEDFITLLNEKEEYVCRALAEANNISFMAINDKRYDALIKKGYPKDILDDVLKSTGLCVKIGREIYPIGISALGGIWRIAVANRDCVPKNIVADFFNAAVSSKTTQKGSTSEYLVQLFGGKIDAFMTGVYTPFPPANFMSIAEKAIRDAYGEIECASTYFDHNVYRSFFKLCGEEATNMEQLFKEQIANRSKRTGCPVLEDDVNINFGLVVKTGETGNETATIKSYISLSSALGISIGEDISIYHKGEKDLESEITSKIGNVFLSFHDTIEALVKSADIKVLDWRATIINLADMAKIPEDVWKAILVEFDNAHKNVEIVTGYDILDAFMSSMTIFKSINTTATDNMVDLYEMKILKILAADIGKYDNDEKEIKKNLSKQNLTYAQNVLVGVCDELKVPVAVRKRLVEELTTRVNFHALENSGEEMPVTALDIYELIVSSAPIMRQWFVSKKNLDADELESRMAKYQKSIAKAKKVSFIAHDKDEDIA